MPLSAVKPENYQYLLDEKAARVTALLAPFKPGQAELYPSSPGAYRMRAEFRIWHEGDELDYVMFRKDEPRTPIPITEFPIACAAIQSLMPALMNIVKASRELRLKLFQIEFLSTLAGDTLITLAYHRKLDEAWEAAAAELQAALEPSEGPISVVGRSRKQKVVVGRDWVEEELTVNGTCYRYRQYEQAFTQPNAEVNIKMIEWACARAENLSGDLLELYCGNGNFTLPLSRHFNHVVATELSKASVKAARENIRENSADNIEMIRLSAQEVTQAITKVREFRRLAELPKALHEYDLRTLFVDPPRAGLDEHTLEMAAGFDSIIYISCNPTTLAENLSVLTKTHRVERFALFDQFPYTDHMESGVLLSKK